MKRKLLHLIIIVTLLLSPKADFGQAPDLGTVANFVLFSTNGAVTNTSITHLTGNVGTNNGSSTGFGNVDGQMHDGDVASAQCATDLLLAYNQLNGATPTFFPSTSLGNGDTLIPGVYYVSAAATLNLTLNLNAQGDPNALFIFQVQGSFSANASAKIKLINGAQACNVFWKVEGLVSLASGVTMRGTIVANNAAIYMGTGDTLEGRALSTTGAITTDGVMAYTPIGCGSPVLMGPTAPILGATACYAIFSSNGAVSNSGTTFVTGDIGTNVGLTTGFNSSDVTGTIHLIPDGSTAQCANDLAVVYYYLSVVPYDINLLYPAQFGSNLVLTPHTYLLDAATTLTDTVILNAEGHGNAVFILKINGALSTNSYSNIKLINGTQSKNVYWLVEGAVTIADNSIFRGTLVVNNGALGTLSTGVFLDGRALTTNGALTTTAINAVATNIPGNCAFVGIPSIDVANGKEAVTISPNPFGSSTTIIINNASLINNAELKIYNVLGSEVMNTRITKQLMTLGTSNLPSGIYFYKIINNNKTIQSGKLVSQ